MNEPDVVTFADKEEASDLIVELAQDIEAGRNPSLILDFGNIPAMSSAFLAKLIRIADVAGKAGGRLVVCNLSAAISEIFERTRLFLIISVAEDVAKARDIFK